jgi:hypothetical protein
MSKANASIKPNTLFFEQLGQIKIYFFNIAASSTLVSATMICLLEIFNSSFSSSSSSSRTQLPMRLGQKHYIIFFEFVKLTVFSASLISDSEKDLRFPFSRLGFSLAVSALLLGILSSLKVELKNLF